MNIYEVLLWLAVASICGFFIWMAFHIKEFGVLVLAAILPACVYFAVTDFCRQQTPLYPVASREAKVLSQFETDRFYSFFYEDDAGAYREARFEKIEDLNKIKAGNTLKVVYYFGKTNVGPDKYETRVEL